MYNWRLNWKLDHKTKNIKEKTPTTLAVSPIYYTFSPDIMKKICNIVHHKYYDFIFKNWDDLTVSDCSDLAKETKNTEIIRYCLKDANNVDKTKILYNMLPFSIEHNLLPMFELLTSSIINNKDCTWSNRSSYTHFLTQCSQIAYKLKRKEMLKYFRNCDKLKKNLNIILDILLKNLEMKEMRNVNYLEGN